MPKPKLLFIDDRTKRIEYALTELAKEYDVTIATCVPEALRQLVAEDWTVVSLDFDLDGRDFGDPTSPASGMEIIRYIRDTGWPTERSKPQFLIHSTNLFAAEMMLRELEYMDFSVKKYPFGWKKYQHGVIAGAFDVIHPGYIEMFADAKKQCHKLTVLLHDKPNQVFSLGDRAAVLMAIRYVDDFYIYKTEEELDEIFKDLKPDIRFVGDDHEGDTSRPDLPFPTYYHKRTTDWSATKFKQMIKEKA